MFEYQPALPIPNGKTCLWLFLSTEIMFFAGLIGTYIVLRFGAVAWPAPHDVHLSEPIGAFNTFVLICSSVTVVLALEAAKLNQDVEGQGLDPADVLWAACSWASSCTSTRRSLPTASIRRSRTAWCTTRPTSTTGRRAQAAATI